MTTVRMITGATPRTAALIDGSISSPDLEVELEVARPTTAAFRKVANDLAFDAGELAVVTYLIAREQHKPLRLLPVVLSTQLELATLMCLEDSPIHAPADLAGKHVATRSYSQTTAVWVRGIIDELAGVGDSMRWSTTEVSHVDGYVDPPGVQSLGEITALDALRSGAVDAALVGLEPGVRVALDEARALEADWRETQGVIPANHFLCVQERLLELDPGLPDALVELFAAAKAAGEHDDNAVEPVGTDEIVATLDRIGLFAHRQRITARRWTAEEMLAR